MITPSATPVAASSIQLLPQVESTLALTQERGLRCHKCGTIVLEEARQVSDLLDEVAKEHMVDVEAMRGRSRFAPLVRARDCAAMRLRSELNLPLKAIGFHLGGRDHSTIITAVKRAEKAVADARA